MTYIYTTVYLVRNIASEGNALFVCPFDAEDHAFYLSLIYAGERWFVRELPVMNIIWLGVHNNDKR